MSRVTIQMPSTVAGLFPQTAADAQDVWVLVPTKASLPGPGSPDPQPPAPQPPAPPPGDATLLQKTDHGTHRFVRCGPVWELQWGNHQVLLRHRKGYAGGTTRLRLRLRLRALSDAGVAPTEDYRVHFHQRLR